MKRESRRRFLKTAAAGAAGFAVWAGKPQAAPYSRIAGANDEIRVAVVGFRGQGRSHIRNYREIPGVRLVALCDADRDVLDKGVEDCRKHSETVTAHTDVRKMLEDDSIDAVSTATPNHWHALVTVWSCQAGKHVCVEKPVSHNVFEGRKMVEAARTYNRMVQADLDLRSQEGVWDAVNYVKEGHLGEILYARIHNYKRRPSIGLTEGPQPVPESADYNLWTGPAPLGPLRRKNLHYDWHWVWDTGNGEIGNNGPHQLDICRWILGHGRLPRRVMSFGGRLGYEDDGETPNSHIAVFDYEPAPLIYESRGLGRAAGDDIMNDFVFATPGGREVRFEHNSKSPNMGWLIQCEDGYLHQLKAYDNAGRETADFNHGGEKPQASFIKALRSGKREDLRADILEGHRSTSLSHLGNISYRLGERAHRDEVAEWTKKDTVLGDTFGRFEQHLRANGVNPGETPLTVGPWLEFDPDREIFAGPLAERANPMLTRGYREPFVVHERV